MFGWLLSLFRRDERCLFRYWDGKKRRAIDHLSAWRKIWTYEAFDFLQVAAIARNPPGPNGERLHKLPEVLEAEDQLRQMTREVFGLRAWSEEEPGLTLDETDALLGEFIDFCEDLKKKRDLSRTLSPPSVLPMPAPSLDIEEFPVGPAADFPYSPSESTDAAPTGP